MAQKLYGIFCFRGKCNLLGCQPLGPDLTTKSSICISRVISTRAPVSLVIVGNGLYWRFECDPLGPDLTGRHSYVDANLFEVDRKVLGELLEDWAKKILPKGFKSRIFMKGGLCSDADFAVWGFYVRVSMSFKTMCVCYDGIKIGQQPTDQVSF